MDGRWQKKLMTLRYTNETEKGAGKCNDGPPGPLAASARWAGLGEGWRATPSGWTPAKRRPARCRSRQQAGAAAAAEAAAVVGGRLLGGGSAREQAHLRGGGAMALPPQTPILSSGVWGGLCPPSPPPGMPISTHHPPRPSSQGGLVGDPRPGGAASPGCATSLARGARSQRHRRSGRGRAGGALGGARGSRKSRSASSQGNSSRDALFCRVASLFARLRWRQRRSPIPPPQFGRKPLRAGG